MNKPYFIAFLLSLALWTVIPSVFAGDVVLKVFEGKPRITPHHLDKENAVVRGGRIPDFVHTLHDGVQEEEELLFLPVQ